MNGVVVGDGSGPGHHELNPAAGGHKAVGCAPVQVGGPFDDEVNIPVGSVGVKDNAVARIASSVNGEHPAIGRHA